jgi:hypothetical protein
MFGKSMKNWFYLRIIPKSRSFSRIKSVALADMGLKLNFTAGTIIIGLRIRII